MTTEGFPCDEKSSADDNSDFARDGQGPRLPEGRRSEDVARREAARRAETEHRIERRMNVRQEAAIRATMAAIKATDNSDGGALQ
jgi:hypothetical protein